MLKNSYVFLDIHFNTCLRSNLLLAHAEGSRSSPYGAAPVRTLRSSGNKNGHRWRTRLDFSGMDGVCWKYEKNPKEHFPLFQRYGIPLDMRDYRDAPDWWACHDMGLETRKMYADDNLKLVKTSIDIRKCRTMPNKVAVAMFTGRELISRRN